MNTNFRSLANEYISQLVPYQPGKPIEELERELGITSAIKLASNENPLGPSPKALAAIQDALSNLHIYPDAGCFQLKQSLGAALQISPEQLTIGNGSENILEMIIKSYLSPGDSSIISQYAFLTIPLLIKSYGAKVISVPAKNYGHDIAKMITAIEEKTRVIFIVNPNNPTGTYTSLTELKHLLQAVPPHILIVIDEAYHEYIQESDYPQTRPLLTEFPNLVITRTFSKIYGLAALRLGYAIASIEITDILNRARLPFNVNSIASTAAIAAIDDHEHVQKSIRMNEEGLQQLRAGLTQFGVSFISTLGNFITLDVKNNSLPIYEKLLRLGVIVRPLLPYQLPSHLRVTVGTYEQNERFLSALHTVLSGEH